MHALHLVRSPEREREEVGDAAGVLADAAPAPPGILLIGRRLVGDEFLPAWVVRLCHRCGRVVCLQYPLPILPADRVLCLTCVVAIAPLPRDRTAARLRAAVELPPWTPDAAVTRAQGSPSH